MLRRTRIAQVAAELSNRSKVSKTRDRLACRKSRSRESVNHGFCLDLPESCALTDTSADVLRTRCGALVLRAAHFYLMTRWILWVQPLSFGATTGRNLQTPKVYPHFSWP